MLESMKNLTISSGKDKSILYDWKLNLITIKSIGVPEDNFVVGRLFEELFRNSICLKMETEQMMFVKFNITINALDLQLE